MLNKGQYFNKEEYKIVYNEAFSKWNIIKKLSDSENEEWKNLYGNCRDSLRNLLKYQNEYSHKLPKFEIGKTAYYLSWLEHGNYCRTGDLLCLNKAFSHYCNIRKMCYFNEKDSKERRTRNEIDTIIKYFSRFIWMCLLVHYSKLLRDLQQEFYQFIVNNKSNIGHNYDLHIDYINKVKQFETSISLFYVKESNNSVLNIENRLMPNELSNVSYSSSDSLTLTEVIVFSNVADQVEIEYRTPDIFRIMHLFEYSIEYIKSQSITSKFNNPIKRVLNTPKFYEFKSCILHSMKRLSGKNAFVLYISTDSNKTDMNISCDSDVEDSDGPKDMQSLNEHVMIRYTRKPLILIVDSKNSSAFKNLYSPFDQPLICLLSPKKTPRNIKYDTKHGNIFTLFLTCPISAMCIICDIKQIKQNKWNSVQGFLQVFNEICLKMIQNTSDLEDYLPFIGDPLMTRIITRYCFSYLVLRHHTHFQEASFVPMSNPPIESFLLDSEPLQEQLNNISQIIDIKSFFEWNIFI